MTGIRRSKLTDLADAVAMVPEGCQLALGGFLFHNRPSAFVRELVKRKTGNLTLLSSPAGSYETDLLIGAGLVTKTYIPHVSFEHLGMAPNYRRAAERGDIQIVEADEATLIGGYMATVEGIPHHPIVSLRGTDLLKHSELISACKAPDGGGLMAVKALAPEIAVLHAQRSDEYGNVQHLGSTFADLIIAKASKTVIVTVDEVIPTERVQEDPRRTTIPCFLVDAVVEVPYGSHPCSSHLLYLQDEDHLREYIRCAKGTDGETFDSYLESYVRSPSSHGEYLERVGGLERMNQLRAR